MKFALDVTKLEPSVAEREEALRLCIANEAAHDAYAEASRKPESEVSNEELGRLVRAKAAAYLAWANYPLNLEFDSDGNPLKCALSGLPIVDDDELLEDEDTGECVLRGLVLPPRTEAAESAEEDANAAAAQAA